MKFSFKTSINISIVIILFSGRVFSQAKPSADHSYLSRIFYEMYPELISQRTFHANSKIKLSFNNKFYLNSNLPNLENIDGLYLPKGYGQINELSFKYSSNYFLIHFEPQLIQRKVFEIYTPSKKGPFSKLNDVPLKKDYQSILKNSGLKIFYKGISAGYGNWSKWWGPGIHNSLVLSNNARGFYHYFVSTDGFLSFFDNFEYKIEFFTSQKMKNINDASFYLSSLSLNLRYKNLETGIIKHILNGGHSDINWNINDALSVIFTNRNLKYWDRYIDFYILLSDKNSGINLYYEVGTPNRHFSNAINKKKYYENAISSNIGLRKYGAFDIKNLTYGIEYTRLVQGVYYNIIPTPNWYDNIKYNYSSYYGRRWAAHSGSDSDDLLLYLGYINKRFSILYGLNYERHGVTYHFPPEVKIESKVSVGYNFKHISCQLKYEDEYYEHYGFIDNNKNVWDETFNFGSIQRTKTLLFEIESTIF